MSHSQSRRSFIQSGATAALFLASKGKALAKQGLQLGTAQKFSFAGLKAEARKLAQKPYQAAPQRANAILDKIDYDAWGKITFNTDDAPYSSEDGLFPVTFFHLGMYFKKPVAMYLVDGTSARAVIYNPDLFNMPADSVAHQLPQGAGFAGFRLQEKRGGSYDWRKNDWVAFLGAAYFRAIGELHQYGLSARGVAVDVAVAGQPEEFPDFTRFYIEEKANSPSVTVYALLEGPSIVGAYQFTLTRGAGVVMDIDHELHLRADISRLGLAPLTSMYWFSETAKPKAADWRPEVHDSDGLALWTGAGERIWRPLNNPPQTTVSAFADNRPRGFGLLQRDRNFDHYLDGVHYELRPSLWVEPKGDWGKGAVQLVEIPTDDEIHDNIVAHWVADEPARKGEVIARAYRLHWLAGEPYPSPLATCVATRLGNGGVPGQPRPKGVRKFLVEFQGGPLEHLAFGEKPEAILSASRGAFSYIFTEAVPDGVVGHWRAQFDLTVEPGAPVEMRCYLRLADKVLSETWAFQYHVF